MWGYVSLASSSYYPRRRKSTGFWLFPSSFFNFYKISPFWRATDAPVLDFWGRLLWVSKPEWAALFFLGGGVHVTHSLILDCGVTSLPCTYEQALVGLKTGTYWVTFRVLDQPDALLTELCRLGWFWLFIMAGCFHCLISNFNPSISPPS